MDLRSFLLVLAWLGTVAAGHLLSPSAFAQTATFTVNSTADEPDAVPGDGRCESFPSFACTLRAAILEANAQDAAHAGGYQINIPPGLYQLTRTGANEDAAQTGDLDTSSNISILGTGASAAEVVIDGNGTDRVFEERRLTLAIQHLTIRNGNAPNTSGAGLSVTAGSISLNDVVLSGNTGFGIYASSANQVALTNLTLANNTLGGMAVHATLQADLSHLTIRDNGGPSSLSATPLTASEIDYTGNATGLTLSGGLTVSSVRVSQNQAIGPSETSLTMAVIGGGSISDITMTDNVGAARALYIGVSQNCSQPNPRFPPNCSGGFASAHNVTVARNSLTGESGVSLSGLSISLTGLVVQGNTTTGDGGGIATRAASTTIQNATISGNHADGVGGGIAHTGGALTMSNVTISGNSANGSGGGLSYTRVASPPLMTNLTIAGNTAGGAGQQVAVQGASGAGPRFANVIVSGATPAANCSGPITSEGANLDNGTSCGFAGANDQTGVDPQLGALTDNGGGLPTLALAAGSPAVDTGRDDVCPQTDERAISRPQDGNNDGTPHCDIGAFERQGTQTITNVDLTVVISAHPSPVANGDSLTYEVIGRNEGPDAAANTTVMVTLPDGVAFISGTASGGCAAAGQVVTCRLGTAEPFVYHTFTIVARPTIPGSFTTSATISGDGFERKPSSNSSSTAIVVAQASDVAVAIEPLPASVAEGSALTYVVRARVDGTLPASEVQLQISASDRSRFFEATPSQGTCQVATGMVTCAAGTVPGGATVTVTLRAIVGSVTPFTTTAKVSEAEIDPAPSNNSATQSTPVAGRCTPRPTVQVTTAAASGALNVTVTVGNTAGVPTNGIVAIRFTGGTNALIDINGMTGQTGAFIVPFASVSGQVTFVVRRATPGQATTVPFVVLDSCGEWPTFVGGGPSAF
jgi:CSLREA domain-containing protein/uncharacterized repeat protein (TIGR01451 family)